MAFRGDVEALVLGALHGYGIAKRLRGTSKALAIGEGQLYPVLHRMESEGLLAANWVDQPGKPDRKTYTLTEAGRAALARGLDRRLDMMEASARSANAQMESLFNTARGRYDEKHVSWAGDRGNPPFLVPVDVGFIDGWGIPIGEVKEFRTGPEAQEVMEKSFERAIKFWATNAVVAKAVAEALWTFDEKRRGIVERS